MQMYDTISPLKTTLKFASNTDNYSKHHRDFAFLTVYELNLYLTKAARKRYEVALILRSKPLVEREMRQIYTL